MANIKSQIKRIKQNEKRHERNKAVKSGLKTAVRKFREAAEAGDKEKAVELGRAANRQLDKAASKGVIHKNQAANRKSAISRKSLLALTPALRSPVANFATGQRISREVAPGQSLFGLRKPATVSTSRSSV